MFRSSISVSYTSSFLFPLIERTEAHYSLKVLTSRKPNLWIFQTKNKFGWRTCYKDFIKNNHPPRRWFHRASCQNATISQCLKWKIRESSQALSQRSSSHALQPLHSHEQHTPKCYNYHNRNNRSTHICHEVFAKRN